MLQFLALYNIFLFTYCIAITFYFSSPNYTVYVYSFTYILDYITYTTTGIICNIEYV